MMIDWHIGTIAFGYDDWVGPFYPPRTKPADYLSYYATRFRAIEIDTTFHGMPDPSRVTKWREKTPSGF